jgi:hypothetical protein
MALDGNIKKAAEALAIIAPEDWCNIRPEQVRAVHGCGPATVDHIRIYLAARGLTMLDDETPLYWQTTLSAAKIGGQVSQVDRAVVFPATILVDTAEQQPWTFAGFHADADQDARPMLVRTELQHLGPTHGDYCLKGFEGRCHIERKGLGDAIGTFLASPGSDRRNRWDSTLQFLSGCEVAAVVIEGSLGKVLATIEARGQRPKPVLQKTLHCQVLAWMVDYQLPFIFCDSRRLAELTTLTIFKRFYRKAVDAKKSVEEKAIDALLAEIL